VASFDYTPPTLIGVIGKKRSGKDTFASALTEEAGWTKVAFADALREAALGLDPLVGEVFYWRTGDDSPRLHPAARLSEVVETLGWERAKDYIPEVRRTLQRLGAESVRALDPDFWIRAARASVEASVNPVVMPDVRYPNEAEAIRSWGGILVRVVRPGRETVDEHSSETALDGYNADYSVSNESTIEDLRAIALLLAGA
jgi:hypothetical protein